MESEIVIIEIRSVYGYSVDATFEFFNYGETTILTVGFPYYGIDSHNFNFSSFRTWVNDQECNFKDIPGELVVSSGDDIKKITDAQEINKIKEK